MRVACYDQDVYDRNGTNEHTNTICPISVIMSDGSTKTGEYTLETSGWRGQESYSDGIDTYVQRNGPYMTTPAAYQISYAYETTGSMGQTNSNATVSGGYMLFGPKTKPVQQNRASVVYQTPQTGDPAANIRQWATVLLGGISIGLAGYAIAQRKRPNAHKTL